MGRINKIKAMLVLLLTYGMLFSAHSKGQLITENPENDVMVTNLPDKVIESQAMLVPQQRNDSVELTETDIARLPSFNGSHATIFGISLGMGRSQVRMMISKYPYLKMEEDPFNPKRFYLQDISNDTGKVTIGYMKWLNYDSGLYQIVLYPPVAKYLRGLSCSIVSTSCVDPESEIYKTFLGEPSSRQITLDMPGINAKTTMLYYPKLNLVIEENKSSKGMQYSIILTHKW
jgi:hypothetical protein